MGIIELYDIYKKFPVVSTNTRNITKDSIFFAIKGDNFNANTFAGKALENGAAYAVIDEEEYLKVLKMFKKEFARTGEKIEEEFENDRIEDAKRRLHSIKAGLSYIGAGRLASHIQKIEEENLGGFTEITELIRRLDDLFEEIEIFESQIDDIKVQGEV